MPTRSNKHIKKYNQLVDVYNPSGIEPLETVSSREEEYLEQRRSETRTVRDRVESLSTADFFDGDEQTAMQDDSSLPDPAEAAQSQRADMIDRLDNIEEALTAELSTEAGIDTADGLGY